MQHVRKHRRNRCLKHFETKASKEHSMMVSSLNPGDHLRNNILFKDKYANGSDRKWSNHIFTARRITKYTDTQKRI